MNIKTKWTFSALAAAALLAGCAMGPSPSEVKTMTDAVIKSSFSSKGIAKLERATNPDETNRACSEADTAGKPLDEKTAKAIEEANFAAIKWPAGGYYLGDWKKGEKVAQSGKGMSWSDKAGAVNGGNCYNCHQISKEEISYGNLGPSLYNYGKIRGVKNPYAPESAAVVQYTWGKIWNAKAYNACSLMPRAGHSGILTEAQVKDIMALLLDPKSPVNR
jgi:sulfur-oxidizing protein SoxX